MSQQLVYPYGAPYLDPLGAAIRRALRLPRMPGAVRAPPHVTYFMAVDAARADGSFTARAMVHADGRVTLTEGWP